MLPPAAQNVQVLVLGNCEYVCYMAKGILIKVEMGEIILDYPGETSLVTGVLKYGRGRQKRSD